MADDLVISTLGRHVSVMPETPKIFLETTVLKYASERIIRGYRIPKTVRWGAVNVIIPMGRWYELYPNERLGWRPWRQRLETMCLPFIAWLASQRRVELICTREVEVELHGLPKTDDPRGLFYGAPITWVLAPAYRAGSLLGSLLGPHVRDAEKMRPKNARERQLEFLADVKRARFIELQKAAGAYQGEGRPPHPNQLLDAFHLWCAESAGADYFLNSIPSCCVTSRAIGAIHLRWGAQPRSSCSSVWTRRVCTPGRIFLDIYLSGFARRGTRERTIPSRSW